MRIYCCVIDFFLKCQGITSSKCSTCLIGSVMCDDFLLFSRRKYYSSRKAFSVNNGYTKRFAQWFAIYISIRRLKLYGWRKNIVYMTCNIHENFIWERNNLEGHSNPNIYSTRNLSIKRYHDIIFMPSDTSTLKKIL